MGKILDSYTFRLFKKHRNMPFIESVSSILDISDNENIYKYDRDEKEADKNSLRADWLQVGKDLTNAIDEYDRSTKNTNRK